MTPDPNWSRERLEQHAAALRNVIASAIAKVRPGTDRSDPVTGEIYGRVDSIRADLAETDKLIAEASE